MPRPIPPPKPSIEALTAAYRNGVLEILARLEFLASRDRSDAAARAALRETKATLAQLDQYVDRWIEQYVPAAYSEGWDRGLDSTLYAVPDSLRGQVQYSQFAQLHRQAIEVMAYNMQEAVKAATATMGRKVDDVFRRVGLEQTMARLFTGETVRDSAGAMKERLILSGLDSFKDKAGRVWRLDNYCSMVARTTTREATTLGTLNRARAGGYHLIRMSEHQPTCGHCAPLQGIVYSLDLKDKRYPMWQDDFCPVHPRCLHTISIYVEHMDPNAEELQQKSQRDLNTDPRSEAEKRAYDSIQAGNKQLNETRRQYERYVARLGTENVGTIQNFARSKRLNTDRYQELLGLFREAGSIAGG